MGKYLAWWFGLAVVVAMAFQNCGPSGFEDNLDQSSQQSSLDQAYAGAPFPYDVTINQLLYSSCTGGAGSNAFTFRGGAYDTEGSLVNISGMTPAGLGLRSDFIEYMKKASGSYAVQLHKDKLKHVLTEHPELATAQVHFSVRNRTDTKNLAYARVAPGSATGSGQLNQFSLVKLNDPGIVDPVFNVFSALPDKDFLPGLNSQARLNYFDQIGLKENRALQVGLQVPVSSNPADQSLFRTDMYNHMLVLGFSNVDLNLTSGFGATPLSPAGAKPVQIYGRGFDVTFTSPGNVDYPRRVLDRIIEKDLSVDPPSQARDQGRSVVWDCSRRFMIVKNEERFNEVYKADGTGYRRAAACPVETYDQLQLGSSPERTAAYFALRRMLPVELWDINISEGCVVPLESGACYSDAGKVVYDQVFFSSPDATLGQMAGCKAGAVDGFYECAHYLTLCLRQQTP